MALKRPESVEGTRVKLEGPLFGRLYKEEYRYIGNWSGRDPNAKMNCFTCSRKDNDWVVPGYQYNNKFKKWRRPINNRQLYAHALKKKIIT